MGTDEAQGVGGSRNGDPFDDSTLVDPIDALLDGGPVDIAAVRHDDALIDAIAGDGPVATDSVDEYQLAMLLAAWRAELNSTPIPAGPDLDTVVAAVNQEIAAVAALGSGRRRLRLLGPATAAAAVIAVVTGVAAISYNANPGDALWSVKEAVFSKQADSTMARIDSSTDLDAAEQALAQGDVNGAKSLLERAGNRANDVNNSAHREDLQDRLDALRTQLEQKQAGSETPSTTPPSMLAPLSTVPFLPPLLLPSTTAATVPPATNQLVPDNTSSTTAVAPIVPTQDLPLLVPTTQPPLTVEPEQPPSPVQPTIVEPPTLPTTQNPPASETNTLVPPPVVTPGAEIPPMTTIRTEPQVLPMPGAGGSSPLEPVTPGISPEAPGGL